MINYLMNIYYNVACILPLLMLIDFVYVYNSDINKNYIYTKSTFHILLISLFIIYNVEQDYFYELIIPILFIVTHLVIILYDVFYQYKNRQINRIIKQRIKFDEPFYTFNQYDELSDDNIDTIDDDFHDDFHNDV